MSQDETREVADRALRDDINITVYGKPVLDVIIDVREGAMHVAEAAAVRSVADIRRAGNLNFKPDTYLSYYIHEDHVAWGPFNRDDSTPSYAMGGKFEIGVKVGADAARISGSSQCALIPKGNDQLGGGAANVLANFYDVFQRLRVELIATTEERRPDSNGRLDPFLSPLIDTVGTYVEIPVYDEASLNLAVEGLGHEKDRIIFKGAIGGERDVGVDVLPTPRGRAVMVNTLNSPAVALDALAYAAAPDRLGFLALTTSLCSKKEVAPEIMVEVLGRHQLKEVDPSAYKSVFDFVREYVLPLGDCIAVLNEEELEHVTGVQVCLDRGGRKTPSLAGVVRGLKEIRRLQSGSQQRVYITLGKDGAVALDERSHLIYCGVVNDQRRNKLGKTAIGDTFATFLLALETIGNYIRANNIPAHDVLKAAAAGADSGVYDGFGNLSVAKVNAYLGNPDRRLLDLGRIDVIASEGAEDLAIEDLQPADWDDLAKADLLDRRDDDSYLPSTLQEVIGRAFLRV